jgi:mono/diheme cytochrome c family protein
VRIAAISCLALVAACQAGGENRAREYFPDMVRGPAYKAFAPNLALKDGLTLQRPVVGTIARGQQPFHFGAGEGEAIRAGQILSNPLPATAATLEDGRGLFQIYCVVCHGPSGKGDGPLAGKIPPPADYRSERVQPFPPGRMFHVLTSGSGKMPSYAGLLSPDERWKVIAYVQTRLQGKVAR